MLPQRIAPMLAQAAAEPFDSPNHLFEIKWDGIRCIAIVEKTRLRLQNRRFIEMRERYPELHVLGNLSHGTVLDGEIVVLDDGRPSFPKLQQREHLQNKNRIEILSKQMPATLIVFDLLYLNGKRVMDLPLAERLDSPYLPGKRSAHWLKIKVAQIAEFEIIGYTLMDGANATDAIGALVLARAREGQLMYMGKVGTGVSGQQRKQIFEVLSQAPAMDDPPKDCPRDAALCASGLRCRVQFFELTKSGRLRAPSFKGLV